jgi:hypothetical protein
MVIWFPVINLTHHTLEGMRQEIGVRRQEGDRCRDPLRLKKWIWAEAPKNHPRFQQRRGILSQPADLIEKYFQLS